jgi:hypothetical protein
MLVIQMALIVKVKEVDNLNGFDMGSAEGPGTDFTPRNRA